MLQKIFILGGFLFLTNLSVLKSQDVHFSNYETFLPALNPAMTGLIPNDDDLRVATIYRDQWRSVLGKNAYKTYGVAFDMRNCISKTNKKHFNNAGSKFKSPTWGLGLMVLHDESGTRSIKEVASHFEKSYVLLRDQVVLSGGILFPTNDRTFLNLGFRVGGILQRIKTSHLSFDEQFDGIAGFDPTIVGEFDPTNPLRNQMFDLGAGVSFMHLQKDWGIIFGGVIDHVFAPLEYQFLESNTPPQLSRKFTAHLKFSYNLNKKKKKPFGVNLKSLFIHQSPFQQLVVVGDLFYQDQYSNGKNFTATVGGGARIVRHATLNRNTDAAFVLVTLNFDTYTFGFNYDINTSNLRSVSNSYGALEFSMIYRWKKRNSGCRPLEIGCPDKDTVHAIFF